MSEIEQRLEVVIPLTGELISLSDPVEVADALERLRAATDQLHDVRRVLEEALRFESERQGTKTLYLGDVKTVVSGGERVDFGDLQELADELREAGLPEERVGEVVVQTYKVNQRVAKQVAAANPRYADVIERHRQVVPAPWRVAVERGRHA